MNQQESTMQTEQSAKYQEWVLEFDTELEVRFDDESDFVVDPDT